jgi:nucleotide-binding universal stress UspA family protein
VQSVILAADGLRSMDTLAEAARVARRAAPHIVVVHVATPLTARRFTGGGHRVADADGQRRVHELIAELQDEGFEAELELHTAAPSRACEIVIESARRHRASTIVIAIDGYSPKVTAQASGVVSALLRDAPCGVVIVPPAPLLRAGASAVKAG